MKVSGTWTRCARKAGGLSLGVFMHFPVSMFDDEFFDAHWWEFDITLGLLFWQYRINVAYGHRYETPAHHINSTTPHTTTIEGGRE